MGWPARKQQRMLWEIQSVTSWPWASNVPLQHRGPAVSWDTSRGMLPACPGRWSFLSTQHWWDRIKESFQLGPSPVKTRSASAACQGLCPAAFWKPPQIKTPQPFCEDLAWRKQWSGEPYEGRSGKNKEDIARLCSVGIIDRRGNGCKLKYNNCHSNVQKNLYNLWGWSNTEQAT